jgi:hypothetical protein
MPWRATKDYDLNLKSAGELVFAMNKLAGVARTLTADCSISRTLPPER